MLPLISFTLLPFLLATPADLGGQSWDWLSAQVEPGQEAITHLIEDGAGVMFGGTYTETIQLAGTTLPNRGDNDILLGEAGPTGDIVAVSSIGGPGDDLPTALRRMADGAFLLAGNYWGSIELLDVTLTVPDDQKALFIAVFESLGAIRWARSVSGSGLKEMSSVVETAEGDIIATGFFGGTLTVGPYTLEAEGKNDLFLASFSPEGEVNWATRAGYRSNTRATALATGLAGSLVVGGYYDDTTAIGTDTLVANTRDRDVFIASFDAAGNPQWARKAGGVHDDDLSGLATTSWGDIFATGFFVGVMNLGEGLSIESSTGFSDFFLLKYSAEGQPAAARAYGGPEVQQPTDLRIVDDKIALCGLFQGTMEIDGRTVSAGGGFSSFFALFETDLDLAYLAAASTEEEVFFRAVVPKGVDQWIAGGTYQGSFRAGSLLIGPGQGYDMVLGGLSMTATSTGEPRPDQAGFRIYPNPAGEWLNISCSASQFQVRLYSLNGRLISGYVSPEVIPLQGLGPGTYWIQCMEPERQHWRKLLIR